MTSAGCLGRGSIGIMTEAAQQQAIMCWPQLDAVDIPSNRQRAVCHAAAQLVACHMVHKQLWHFARLPAERLPVSHQTSYACCRAAEEASQSLRKLDSRAAAAVKTAKQAASMLKVGHPG